MSKISLTILVVILIVLPGAGCSVLKTDTWSRIDVPSGNFSVECPDDRAEMNDDDTGYLFCKGQDADYIVHSELLPNYEYGVVEKVIEEAKEKNAVFEQVFSSRTIEKDGRTIQETIAKEQLLVPEAERGSLYDWLRNKEKDRLLIFEQVFFAANRRMVLTVRYELDDPLKYQEVLDRNKANRERFVNSLKMLNEK